MWSEWENYACSRKCQHDGKVVLITLVAEVWKGEAEETIMALKGALSVPINMFKALMGSAQPELGGRASRASAVANSWGPRDQSCGQTLERPMWGRTRMDEDRRVPGVVCRTQCSCVLTYFVRACSFGGHRGDQGGGVISYVWHQNVRDALVEGSRFLLNLLTINAALMYRPFITLC